MADESSEYVSRAGLKLHHAIHAFTIDVTNKVCADLGSNVGGFVDCLLKHGAAKVYAVEKGYGVVDWKLRNDPRVVVMERTNAMHVSLPEPAAVVTIDVAWTKQRNILPAARRLLGPDGIVITLIKPQYEADASMLRKGILLEENLPQVLEIVERNITQAGFEKVAIDTSPIKGSQGNLELLALLRIAKV